MRNPRTRSGFTLIELLTVIAIIAILMAMLLPTANQVKLQTKKAAALNDMKNLVTAVNSFHTEYSVYPIDPALESQGPRDIEYGAPGTSLHNQEVVNVLRADDNPADTLSTSGALPTSVNTRETNYLQEPLVKNSTNPYSGLGTGRETNGITTKSGEWYDPFGVPYIVDLNGKNDGYVQPAGALLLRYSDVNYVTHQGGPSVQTAVIAGSIGADRIQAPTAATRVYKNSNDVLSWQ
jgi:prepilin-type N-terminal cleavage/methylation domain-containing protein